MRAWGWPLALALSFTAGIALIALAGEERTSGVLVGEALSIASPLTFLYHFFKEMFL